MFVSRKQFTALIEDYEDLLAQRDARIHALEADNSWLDKQRVRLLNENRRLKADLVLAHLD